MPHRHEPFVNVLRNIRDARRFVFDIGNTVVKIAYIATVERTRTTKDHDVSPRPDDALRLHCIQLRLASFEACLDFIAKNVRRELHSVAFASTFKTCEYAPMIAQKLRVKLHQVNEMDCLVRGTNFLVRNILDEAFTYDHHNDQCRYNFETIDPGVVCPYLLVNVGTGVSVFKVDSDTRYERVGGSSLGGGTFFGIGYLLTHVRDLDQMMKMAEDGDHRQFDILVSDIYGGKYKSMGLPGDLIAGSFGKCSDREWVEGLKRQDGFDKDFVRSLLLMISNSIGQFAVLYAQREKTRRIFFNGFLIRNHPIIMRTISYAVDFWSGGQQQARFLRHEGYTAALGSLLHLTERESDDICSRYSWREHYAGCSDLGRFVPKKPLSMGFQAGVLELECAEMKLERFPLLKENTEYVPDTHDLNTDEEARLYWIDTMETSVDKMLAKAVESQSASPDAAQRGQVFKHKFTNQLKLIREKPFAYGSCNVRNLLDLREQILQEQGFDDSFLRQKMLENDAALAELPRVLREIDAHTDFETRLLAASKGLLAGNVFDWGAKEVRQMMESDEGLSFDRAVATIPDFLLGVIPFARELLKMGTKVIIVANFWPALNDITYREMMELVPRIGEVDPLLAESVRSRRLMFQSSGQGSPCLDLRRVNEDLCSLVSSEEVDLVVIEGMGRALHTNYEARFSCDALKAAVIKTKWVADRMGGEIFSTVFRFEEAEKEERKEKIEEGGERVSPRL